MIKDNQQKMCCTEVNKVVFFTCNSSRTVQLVQCDGHQGYCFIVSFCIFQVTILSKVSRGCPDGKQYHLLITVHMLQYMYTYLPAACCTDNKEIYRVGRTRRHNCFPMMQQFYGVCAVVPSETARGRRRMHIIMEDTYGPQQSTITLPETLINQQTEDTYCNNNGLWKFFLHLRNEKIHKRQLFALISFGPLPCASLVFPTGHYKYISTVGHKLVFKPHVHN